MLTYSLMTDAAKETFAIIASLCPGRGRPWLEYDAVAKLRYDDGSRANFHWVTKHLKLFEEFRLIQCWPETSFISGIKPTKFRLTTAGKKEANKVETNAT